jgi:hypothetical protein
MSFKRLVLSALAILFASAFSVAPAFASDQTDAVATVQQFIDGLNKGDTTTALAACSAQAAIIDEFPPHEWQGQGACSAWLTAYVADSKKNGITDGVVTLGTPWHVDVTGSRAYVVTPADYAYKQNGKTVTETQSILTVALEKTAGGWRITGWAWARH